MQESSLSPSEARLLRFSVIIYAKQMRHTRRPALPIPTRDRPRIGRLLFPTDRLIIEAEDQLQALGEDELVCISRNRRANILAENGDLDEADALYKSIEEAATGVDSSWVADMLVIAVGNRGVLYNRKELWEDAIVLLKSVNKQLAQSSERAVVLAELSYAHYQLGNYSVATEYWDEASKLCDSLAIPRPNCESNPEWQLPARQRNWRNFWRS